MRELSDAELTAQGGIIPILLASSEPCGMAAAFAISWLFD
jgi:hypothetical protein